MKKVLHITNWYPNRWDNIEGIFVKEQFGLFSQVTEARLLHVEVRESRHWLRYEKVRYSEYETGYYLLTRIKTFRIIEWLSTLLLLWALFQNNAKKYDVLHFHIAYPLLTYYYLWKKAVQIPVIISEHWSAYHFNFFMPTETTKLDRIKNIFHQGFPLITVSRALLKDIQTFSATHEFPAYVIHNVIDHNVYFYKPLETKKSKPVFFIVNFWSSIKNPFPMLEAFSKLVEKGIDFELRIGGYGPILEAMEAFVDKNRLKEHTVFLGKIYKEEIVREMNYADAYLFSSEYETFSIVCAEALCSGTRLMGPPILAILEYTNAEDIDIVDKNDSKSWENTLTVFIKKNQYGYDKQQISQRYRNYFSNKKIQDTYEKIIMKEIFHRLIPSKDEK